MDQEKKSIDNNGRLSLKKKHKNRNEVWKTLPVALS